MQKAIHVSSVCSSILDVILFACVFSSTCKLMLELRKNKGNLGWKGLLVVGLGNLGRRRGSSGSGSSGGGSFAIYWGKGRDFFLE